MTTTQASDIVSLLGADHHQIESLLSQWDQTSTDQRPEYFRGLVRTLVQHEVAEEVVVYPTVRSDAPQGDREADARLAEQAEAEELLATMENLDPESNEFVQKFTKLRSAVLAHAQAEESSVFPLLRESEDLESRLLLGGRYEKAKATAPTHPHPHAPNTPSGNKLLGPVAAMFDRARDAAKGA